MRVVDLDESATPHSSKTMLLQKSKNIRYACLSVKGPRLFNILPVELRNLKNISVKAFKRTLDRYLATVPDEPLIPGYTAMRRADSNSLLDMISVS